MGGGDQFEIDPLRLAAAQRGDFTLLQHAQQTRLHMQRHVADLIQKQASAIGLEQAAFASGGVGTGKGAAPITEQLGLDQLIRQGGAVDGDQRLMGAMTGLVQCLDHFLLADAGLALQQQWQAGVHQPRQQFADPGPAGIAMMQARKARVARSLSSGYLGRWLAFWALGRRAGHDPWPGRGCTQGVAGEARVLRERHTLRLGELGQRRPVQLPACQRLAQQQVDVIAGGAAVAVRSMGCAVRCVGCVVRG